MVTVLVLVILSILGTAALTLTNTELLIARNMILNSKAFYDAEAKVQHTFHEIKQAIQDETNANDWNCTVPGFSLKNPPLTSWNNPFIFEVTGNASEAVCTLEVGIEVGSSPQGSGIFEGGIVGYDGVTTTGSSGTSGDILTGGDVNIEANANYDGNISAAGNVFFENTATVNGNVYANHAVEFNNGANVNNSVACGGDVTFQNTGAIVDGDVKTEGVVVNPHSHWKPSTDFVGGTITENYEGRTPITAPSMPEGAFTDQMASGFSDLSGISSLNTVNVGDWPKVDWQISPDSIQAYDQTWDVNDWVVEGYSEETEFLDANRKVIRTGDLNLDGSGSITIKGGDVTLFVDGDLTFGGGGEGLIIEDNSTLQIYTTGETDLGSGLSMEGVEAVTEDGRPTFSLFSSYTEDNGVTIGGDSEWTAHVFAPYTKVTVTGSGELTGSVVGKEVDVTGNGGVLNYDDAVSGWSPTPTPSDPSISSWAESRFLD